MRYEKTLQRFARNLLNSRRKRPSMLMASILLTYRCTQRCQQCSAPHIQTQRPFMPVNDVRQVLDTLSRQGTQGITFSGGEPMLHPELDACVRLAKERHFLRVHLLTSLFGPDDMVERTIDIVLRHGISVSCSFDGFGKLADELRGVPDVAETVMRNMHKLDKANRQRRRPVQVGVNVALNRRNLSQLPDIIAFVEELGWKINIDIYRWASERHSEVDQLKLEPNDELRAAIELALRSPSVLTPDWLLKGFITYLEGNAPKRCPYLDLPSFGSKFFINPDGEVEVCIGGSIGNILRNTPEELFTSAAWWQRLREFKKCPGCWNTCYTLTSGLFYEKRPEDILKMLRLTFPGREFPRVFSCYRSKQTGTPSRVESAWC
ncbi:MAG: radical SAM protein [Candidatus Cloacimonetes bacterium]|nr:radical SAM protein [Candidatus Cloacimonadota bacterium]